MRSWQFSKAVPWHDNGNSVLQNRMSSYVPLWCKSNSSFLEGTSHPDELVEEAQRLGLPALALTDRDGVYGVVRYRVLRLIR